MWRDGRPGKLTFGNLADEEQRREDTPDKRPVSTAVFVQRHQPGINDARENNAPT